MAVQWTTEQRKIIDSRNQNLLVAAAAGSGKTAVLVQHIMELILDPIEPVSVDELLVVTFTRAAAAEMKERLRKKMEAYLEEHPEEIRLRRQISLLEQAHICTTDSFCSWLVKNYFYRLDLDPDFRILDETEGRLLREDVMDALLEDCYREGKEDFLHLVDGFTGDRSDRSLRELILNVNRHADAMPWPEEWMESLTDVPADVAKLEDFPWVSKLKNQILHELDQWYLMILWAEKTCDENPWLMKYRDMFASDQMGIHAVREAKDLESMLSALANISFIRKPTIAAKTIQEPALKDALSALRDMVKKGVGKIQSKYQIADTMAITEAINRTAADRIALAELSLEFFRRYRKAKKDKNVAEFGDVAHWALQLLLDYNEGEETPTELADELGRTFREIIVDEYQDSNLIQEKLLTALSGERFGHPDMFMVGDVKQSIYKFRMARPELFMTKYRDFSYEEHTGTGCKIDLGKNFRSRASVLQEANTIFEQIMSMEYGGIAYDDHAKLYHGNGDYPGEDPAPELLMIYNEEKDADSPELEARAIAVRIREMMDPENPTMIWDGDQKQMRPVRYSDMVILLRTLEGWAEEIQMSLIQQGIPAFTEQKKGYFRAYEVQVLMSLLQIIDNPMQDIPLAVVLHSPLGGFDDQLLAEMAAGREEDCFWNRCSHAAEQGIGTDQWNTFVSMLERYREEAAYLSIAELLEKILRETHYDRMLSASPDGLVCMANVEMLIEKARAYEETMYHGIFHFLRYMEKLRSYDMDFGEAQVLSETENLVRITSIHKSKGLEYPVVFVSGLSKQFNMQDTHSAFLIDEELGLVCDEIDPDRRSRVSLPNRKYVMGRMADDARQEEMRVLYVALTRAKERLICTATINNPKSLEADRAVGGLWRSIRAEIDESGEKYLPSVLVSGANSYMSWMAMAVLDNPSANWLVREFYVTDLIEEEVRKMGLEDMQKRMWLESGFTQDVNEEILRRCTDASQWIYPWKASIGQKSVVSVSELKHEAAEKYRESMESTLVTSQKQKAAYLNGENIGAKRGTAYHLVFEKLPASSIHTVTDVEVGMKGLLERGFLEPEIVPYLEPERIFEFYCSDIGKRMADAERKGLLFKEQPFVMGVPMKMQEGDLEEEYVLVQGIIDAFLVEDGEIVLWDYKTDRVPDEEPERYLRGQYSRQLNLYKQAIQRSRGQRVKEVWIYSVPLGRMIPVYDDAIEEGEE